MPRKAMSELLHGRNDKNVGSRVMKGAAFIAGAKLVVRLFSFINLLVLARLLNPHDYGIAALAISTITLLQAVSDVRVNAAIINFRALDERHIDTGFTISMVRGLILGAAMILFAQVFADFSRSPDLAQPLRVLALVPILDGLKNPNFVLYQRNIDFSLEFRRTALSTVIASVVAIAAALWLRNYWALVLATVVQRFAMSALTYWGVPVRLRISFHSWREFAGFGGWLTLAGILDYLRNSFGPNFVLGRYLGSHALGLFSIGQTLAGLATRELSLPISQAVAPGFAAIIHDLPRVRAAYRDAQSMIFGFVAPAAVGLAAMARDLIVLTAGAKWEEAAIVVQWLAPVYSVQLLNAGSVAVAQAMNRPRLVFERNLQITALMLPALWAASAYGDLRWALIALSAGSLVNTAVTMRMAGRLIEAPWAEAITRNLRTLAAAAVMGAVLLFLGQSDETRTWPLFLFVAPRVLLGAMLFYGTLFLLWRVAGRPDGFERKLLELAELKAPARLRPLIGRLRRG